MNSNYKRVSRHRTCLICGKPDWCSYTPDSKISFCARIITNADRVSRTGWGVFYHEKSLFVDAPLPFPSKPPPKKAELAPIEIRDFVYRKLIELAPATNSQEIIDGPKGLRSRKILNFEKYGSLPKKVSERHDLAKIIRASLNRKFPDYVRKFKFNISGIPGFWLDASGKVQIWSEKDYLYPLMLIPYQNAQGLIQACQIRFMCQKFINYRVRYVWLSTPNKNGGLSCGSPLHFTSYDAFSKGKPILITEGALKAATAAQFLDTKYNVLANAGVGCSHHEIIAAAQSRSILIAFDTDYYENLYVAGAIARLINSIFSEAKLGLQNQVEILTWNSRIKGIDDALLQDASITHQTPFEWFKSLSNVCQKEVSEMLPNWLVSLELQNSII